MTTNRVERVQREGGACDLHVWLPDGGRGPGIVLVQEIFGVSSFIEAVGERLAGLGYVVGAPDLYWRTRPGYRADHDEEGLNESLAAVQELDMGKAVEDCVAAIDHLAGLPEVDGRPAILGYCLGGSMAFGAAAADDPACCVSYYGSAVPDQLDLLGSVTCPTLFHFGDADPYIPFEGVERVRDAIAERERFELNVEHAGHAFENHDAPAFHVEAAARSSWDRTVAFLTAHLPTAAGEPAR